MSIEGRIAIDIGFTDTHTTDGVQNVQRISLVDTTSYTTGKVAVLTGTAGTEETFISVAPTTYRNSAGDLVSFSSVSRVVFAATPAAFLEYEDVPPYILNGQASRSNRPVVMEVSGTFGQGSFGESSLTYYVSVYTTAGTASYTLALYGT